LKNSVTAAMPDSDDSDKIEIFLSDDQKIKSVGELLTNSSSRTILQLLFEEELTANEISQRSEISLQLVRYHLNKMRQVGMVRISRVGKTSKAHDMKYYRATKFAIVILPSKVSDRARESRSLIRSFRTIYKFAGIGVAAVAGLFSISFLQEQSGVPAGPERRDSVHQTAPSAAETAERGPSGVYMGNVGSEGETGQNTLEEALEIQRRRVEAVNENPASSSGTPYMDTGGDWLLAAIIIAAVLGGLAAYFFLKARRHPVMQKS